MGLYKQHMQVDLNTVDLNILKWLDWSFKKYCYHGEKNIQKDAFVDYWSEWIEYIYALLNQIHFGYKNCMFYEHLVMVLSSSSFIFC